MLQARGIGCTHTNSVHSLRVNHKKTIMWIWAGTMKKLLMLSTAAITLGLCAPAQSQQFNRSIAFGDSLSDNGNLFGLTGNPPSPPYNRRFTNGLIWNEYLFGPSNQPFLTGNVTGNVNLAFGGARTDLAPNSNGPIPSSGTQINTYIALGGRFGAGDVVSIWAGANNVFQGLPVAAANPATAQATIAGIATAAATDVANQTRQVAGLGAGTVVVFNLPNFSQLPQFRATPAEALAGFGSGTFSTSLSTQLAAVAAGTAANIITIPADQIFAAVVSNPSAFGISNTTQACITVLSCVTGSPAVQNSFLFFDGVHPTTTGQLIVAASVGEYLQAPSRAAGISNTLGNTSFAARRTAALDSMTQLSTVAPAPGKWEYFIFATGEAGRSNATFQNGVLASSGVNTARGNDYRLGGIRFGGLNNIGNGWTAGAQFSITTGNLQGRAGKFETDATQISADFLARWRSPSGLFVNLGLGFGVDNFAQYSYRTLGPLQNKASPDGNSLSATSEVGYDVKFGSATTLTPQLRASYLRTSLQKFNESGVIAPVGFDGRIIQGLAGAAEVKLSQQFTPTVSGYVLAGYEGFIAASADAVTGRLVGNTAQPFRVSVQDPTSPGFVFGAGLQAQFGDWTGRLNYRGTTGERSQTTHSGNIGVSVKF